MDVPGEVTFAATIDKALHYWQQRTRGDLAALDQDRHNLYRAAQFGLTHPDTRVAASELALELYPLVMARGYWREWAPLLGQALDRCPPEERRLHISLLNFLGQALRVAGKVEESIAKHETAAALCEPVGDPFACSESLHFLARAHLDARHYPLAEQYAQAVLELPPVDTPLGRHYVADSLRTLALSARARGDFELAVATMEQALEIWRQMEDSYHVATGLLEMGLILRLAGDLDGALEQFMQAASLVNGTVHLLDQISIQYNIGVVHFAHEDWPAAEAAFRHIDVSYFRETGNLAWEANIMGALGNSVLYQGRFDEAVGLLQRAVDIRRQLEDPVELANAVGALGEALAGQGQRGQANACYDEAIDLLAAFPDHTRSCRLSMFFAQKKEELGS